MLYNVASHVGHYDMLSYFAVAQNDSIGRVRYQMYEVSMKLLIYHLLCFSYLRHYYY